MKKQRLKRVRYHHRHLWLHFFGVQSIPFLAVIGYLGYLMYKENLYTQWNHYYMAIIGVLVFDVLLFIYIRFFFFRKEWRISMIQRQKIARMIVNNGLYSFETVRDEETTTTKVTYFPKIYYSIKNRVVDVYFPLDMSKFQDNYLKMNGTLEIGLNADLRDIEYTDDFVKYQLLYKPIESRIEIEEMMVTDRSIQLMNGVEWEFIKYPHALITGGTSSGKTITLHTIIWALKKIGAQITIADPKMSDLSFLEYAKPFEKSVFYKKNGIEMAIRKFKEEMDDRMVEYREKAANRTGLTALDLGFPLRVLVLDELNSYLDTLDYKQKEVVLQSLKAITMLGRQLGFLLIVGLQRADAQYLPDGMRDQFGLRIALGKLSSTGYTMMFDDQTKEYKALNVKGFGYVFNGYGRVMEFYSPFVPQGFEFVERFNRDYSESAAGVDQAERLVD